MAALISELEGATAGEKQRRSRVDQASHSTKYSAATCGSSIAAAETELSRRDFRSLCLRALQSFWAGLVTSLCAAATLAASDAPQTTPKNPEVEPRRAKEILGNAVSLHPDNVEAPLDVYTYYQEAPGIVGDSNRADAEQAEEIKRRDAHGQMMTNYPSLSDSPPSHLEEQTIPWAFTASSYIYLVPESRDYVQPTLTLERRSLHLEARYNYENLNTGSAWLGYKFGGDKKLAWELTPMLGGVFGNTTGVAPGYRGSLSWWKFEVASEGEYLFDVGELSDSFFYNWSELSVAPVDWFRLGLATQRTRLYKSDRDLQRGVVLGVRYKKLDCAVYLFNPDESKPTIVLGITFSL